MYQFETDSPLLSASAANTTGLMVPLLFKQSLQPGQIVHNPAFGRLGQEYCLGYTARQFHKGKDWS